MTDELLEPFLLPYLVASSRAGVGSRKGSSSSSVIFSDYSYVLLLINYLRLFTANTCSDSCLSLHCELKKASSVTKCCGTCCKACTQSRRPKCGKH